MFHHLEFHPGQSDRAHMIGLKISHNYEQTDHKIRYSGSYNRGPLIEVFSLPWHVNNVLTGLLCDWSTIQWYQILLSGDIQFSVELLPFLFLNLYKLLPFGFLHSFIAGILSSFFWFFSWCYLIVGHIFRWRIVLFRRFFWLFPGANTFIALCRFAGGPRTWVPSVTWWRICTGSCSSHGSFSTRHGTRSVLTPCRVTAVYRANVSVTGLFLFSCSFARFAAEHRRRVVALPSSGFFSSSARSVALREGAPLAEFSVHRADFQKARFLILGRTEAIAVLAVFSRCWLFAQAIACLNAFAALPAAVTPWTPFSVAAIVCSSKVRVITPDNKTAQSQGKAKRW